MIGTSGASLGKWHRYIQGADANPALTVDQVSTGSCQVWKVNGTTVMEIDEDGNIIPGTGSARSLGEAGTTFGSLYVDVVVAGGSVTGDLTFDDEYGCVFGTGSDSRVIYSAQDANAFMLQVGLPHIDEAANNVAVMALVDRDALGTDIGASGIDLSGITEPTLAIGNEATDAYVSLDAGDVNGAGKGLYYHAAADEDINLLKIAGATDTGTLIWDTSVTGFVSNQNLAVANQDKIGAMTSGGSLSFYMTVSGASAATLINTAATTTNFTAYRNVVFNTSSSYTFQFNRAILESEYIQFTEMAAPGAGAANTARIYALEGAGDALTDLCAVFQDGTVDVFAQESTEPDSPIFQFPDMTDLKLQLRKPDNKTVQFAAIFPDGREFIMRELRYPVERW